jgi:MoxR-like ATPase
MPDRLQLAVQIALATRRPLLLFGDPGSGKSSLAAHIAHTRNWRYYEHVVTSRTVTQDLLWTFDAVRRFADASAHAAAGTPFDEHRYVTPGVLWWAFDYSSALRRGANAVPASTATEPLQTINADRDEGGAVVLIDEIDKADPDMPNGILVPLGSGEFTVVETGTRVRQRGADGRPGQRLIVITSNGERELPQPFIRRCVVASLKAPDARELEMIAVEHLNAYEGGVSPESLALARELAREVVKARKPAQMYGHRAPSTAEYLDALSACRRLRIKVGDELWAGLMEFTLLKSDHGAGPDGLPDTVGEWHE